MKSVWKLVFIYESMQEKKQQRKVVGKGQFLRQMRKWQMELCVHSVDSTWCNFFLKTVILALWNLFQEPVYWY